MHNEYINVSKETCDRIIQAKKNDGKIVAVGTTSIRSLESAGQSGEIKPYKGDTDIFIYPGYEFKFVDSLITNFHLPKSTLLMLVSALTGRKFMLKVYELAVRKKYRFYSFGDGMFIG